MTVGRRPLSHITAPRNWMNDPNGLVVHDGRYHVFYQYNPVAPTWGPPLWGHVSSSDLARWEDHEPALVPRPDGPDRDGCWSGCCRIVAGRPTIFYTAVVVADGRRTEAVCTATGSPDLLRWTQAPTPIIPRPPAEIERGYHRDPFVFGAPGAWRMLIGSGFLGGRQDAGGILQYVSEDLVTWAYRGVLVQRAAGVGPIDTGPLWECPQLLSSGDTDVLVFSVNAEDGSPDQLRYPVACTGTLTADEFEIRDIARLDHGNVFYAPAILEVPGEGVRMWGWIQEKHGRVDVDHSGALSLPRAVTVVDGRLRMEPAPELAALRGRSSSLGVLRPGAHLDLDGSAMELQADVSPGARLRLELGSVAGAPYRLVLDAAAGTVSVTSGASGPFVAPWPSSTRPSRLHLFVDGPVIELFVGDEVAITTRYDEPPPERLSVGADGVGVLEGSVLHELLPAMVSRFPAG